MLLACAVGTVVIRSNFHLNGTVEPVELDPALEEVACRAARVLGLRVAGVDLLESIHGPLVLEVNSSPGLEGIEKASGVNVAGEIVDFVINDAVFTEVELDKLLRTVPGEGVLSIQLLHHPNLIGHSIDEIFANAGSARLCTQPWRQDDVECRSNGCSR